MRVSGSFRIMGKTLVPEDISALLEMDADESHRLGDRNVGKEGREYSPFREGAWILNNKTSAVTIDDLVCEFASSLLTRREQLRELASLGFRMDFFICVGSDESNIGIDLSPNALAIMADLGVAVSFDIYLLPDLEMETTPNGTVV